MSKIRLDPNRSILFFPEMCYDIIIMLLIPEMINDIELSVAHLG